MVAGFQAERVFQLFEWNTLFQMKWTRSQPHEKTGVLGGEMRAGETISVKHSSAVDWLRFEYFRRKSRNRSYSLRAFARQLHVPPGPLSEILSQKRPLTAKVARRIAESLAYGPEETEEALKLVDGGIGHSNNEESKAKGPLPDLISRRIEADTFSLISDWYHYAILSLVETDDFRNDLSWIARRLCISSLEARAAMERLFRLGLIQKTANSLAATQGWTTTHNIPSAAIRKFHRQSLEQSMEALESVPVEERDVTSITMAIDVSKREVAKKEIRRFRRRMARLLEEGNKTEVYQLNIQLIPLSRGKHK